MQAGSTSTAILKLNETIVLEYASGAWYRISTSVGGGDDNYNRFFGIIFP